jgi:acyl carrier protein
MTKEEILALLKAEVSRETGLLLSEIGDHEEFYSMGLDSIRSVYILDRLEKKLKIELNPIFFWDYPTLDLLSGHLATLKKDE